MDTTSLLFALLRHAVCGEELNNETRIACTPQNLTQVYALAKRHDLTHLVAYAVDGLDIGDSDLLEKLEKSKATAIFRYTRLDYEFERICTILENGKIPFIPLKGSVLRPFYPQGWMRSSCDIDVLVQPETLQKAVGLLENIGYQRSGKGHHDVSLFAPGGVHLELHYSLMDEADSTAVQEILSTVWAQAERKSGYESQYVMTDGMFYLYHIAHMAVHFLRGGCGIRSFLDIWILNHCVPGNLSEREMLLSQSGLLAFAKAAEKLTAYWFANESADSETLRFGNCVLDGGIYGTLKNGAS